MTADNEIKLSQYRWCTYVVIFLCALIIIVDLPILLAQLFDITKIDLISYYQKDEFFEFFTVLCATSLLMQFKENTNRFSYYIAKCLAFIVCVASFVSIINDFYDSKVILHIFNMQFLTEFCFLLIAVSLLLLDSNLAKKGMIQVIVLIVFLSSLFSLLGYVFHVGDFPIVKYTQMDKTTSLLFFILCVAILLSRPDRGFVKILFSNSLSGTLLRRVPLLVFLVSAVIAILTNEGQVLGVYDDKFGDLITLISTIAILIIILWVNASILSKEEQKRSQVELALSENVALFQEFTENINEVFWKATPKMKKILYVSPAFEEIWGYSQEKLYANPTLWMDSIAKDKQQEFKKLFLEDSSKINEMEFKITRPDNYIRYIYARKFEKRDKNNQVIYLFGIATDVTTQHYTKERTIAQYEMAQLMQSEIDLKKIATKILQIICERLDWDVGEIWMVDAKENVIRRHFLWKDSSFDSSTISSEKGNITFNIGDGLPGHIWKSKRSFSNIDIRQDFHTQSDFRSNLAAPIIHQDIVYGVIVFFSKFAKKIDSVQLSSIEVLGFLLGEYIAHLNTKNTMFQINEKDNLTGLINRATLEEKLSEKIKAATDSDLLAVIIFDLDKFKLINNTLGYEAGDQLLKQVANRLSIFNFSTGDIVGRVAADKFVIIPDKISNTNQAVEYASRIFSLFKDVFYINQKEFLITINVGISFFPKDGNDAVELLKNADIALGKSKHEGENNFQLFTKELHVELADRLAVENELRHAIAKNQFVLYYQPKIDLNTGKISSIESLIRWNHPERGLLLPGAFMDIAEESGLIISMTEWVIREVFSKIADGTLAVPVAINLSARHLSEDYNLVGYLQQMLKGFHIHPEKIELEITETVLMYHTSRVLSILANLKRLGFLLTLDDFGTKFSSLSYLKNIAVDKVKIDKIFIDNVPEIAENLPIIKAILALFHSLGKRVVVEGVENIEQVKFLVKEGCDEIQGFYFLKPVSLEEIKKLVDEDATWEIPKV